MPTHSTRRLLANGLLNSLLIGLFSLMAAPHAAAQMQFDVTDEAGLITAIEVVSVDFARSSDRGPCEIRLMGDITLTRSMPSLRTFSPPASSFAVYIEGNGLGSTPNNAGRVFVFASGKFLIAHLTIANARAATHWRPRRRQLRGRGGGGGGLGAGPAIFVGPEATVTASGVIFENAASIGGSGGSFFASATSYSRGGGGGGLNGPGGAVSGAPANYRGWGGAGGGGYLGAGAASTTARAAASKGRAALATGTAPEASTDMPSLAASPR
jgi:hypothetical protein